MLWDYRVGYYANSDATVQLLLLKSGDVSPNPGPSESRTEIVRPMHNVPKQTQRITYDGTSLHNLKPLINCNRLDNIVLHRIKALGISRKRKTHRGSTGARRRRQQQCLLLPEPCDSPVSAASQLYVDTCILSRSWCIFRPAWSYSVFIVKTLQHVEI